MKVIGGFQFSSHKSDDEWREFGINHFVIPQVLISNIGQTTYLTYTVERAQFDIEQFKVVNYFEETHKSDDETLGNTYNFNINIGQTTYLTYTVERAQFDIEQFKEVVNYFEETQIAKAEHDETLGNILRMEDIYVDEWKELVRDAIALDETKNRSCKTSYD